MDQQKVIYISGDILNVWNFFEILIYKEGIYMNLLFVCCKYIIILRDKYIKIINYFTFT